MQINEKTSMDTFSVSQPIPVIDWQLAVKLANNRPELAKEMLDLLVKSLATELQQIRQSIENKQYVTLAKQIHKLHGAICYCGVPRLKKAVAYLDAALKYETHEDLPNLFQDFEAEAQQLLKTAY